MRHLALVLAASALIGAAPPKKPSPSEIIAAAPATAWRPIPAEDLLVIDFAPTGRAVVQLAPQFAPVHVANIRALARADFWNGASVYRVQDNFVAQWGNNDSGKPWPAGVVEKPPAEYQRPLKGLKIVPLGNGDPYAPAVGYADGWRVAYSPKGGWATLAHCYGLVGAGRDLAPDTGAGAELYAIIGHAPRHLDRNLAIVGRVIEGIDRLASLPRGTEDLGMYKDKAQSLPITRVRLAADMPASERPAFEVMDTNSATFAQVKEMRRRRVDEFYVQPSLGADLCSIGVPIRKKP